ncbi:MAG: hypothetical protein K0R66_126 [Gammaproteobacteria bacterium]|jgi:uncharacterized DUF497 family protein|nr:hypothetical protein [Gammaproteobacteria bacterium]
MKFDKPIEWSEGKNKLLIEQRDLSFEAISIAIDNGYLLDVIDNPSVEYPHQKMLVVEVDEYVVLVPFVEDKEKIFLKTAFRSRKANKKFKGE